jgi:hypothetical protein
MVIVTSRISEFSDKCRCLRGKLWLGWRESQAKDLASPGDGPLMLTQDESPATRWAASVPSHKLLQLLRKRLRQLAWVTFVLVICLALGGTALAIWWVTSLRGLPDIGEPFNVAAFRALRIPDDQNAFTFLGRANQELTPWPDLPRAAGLAAPTVAWSKAHPKLRAFVEANRQALELFHQAADRSDAMVDLAGDPSTAGGPVNLSVLALLEGGRRQESGDTAGAWCCYRAVLRMAAHVTGRGSLNQRLRVNLLMLARGWLEQRLATWAVDPRTTISQLKSALDEVLKAEPKPAWDSFAIKTGYVELMRSLERPMDPLDQQGIEGEWTIRLDDMQLPAGMIAKIEASRRLLLREPERSRRVLRLLHANWLAHVESGELRPRKPAVRAVLTAMKPQSVLLFAVGADAPAGARALPPQEVASWLVTTHDAKLRLLWVRSPDGTWPPNCRAYRAAHRKLVIMLATEIYHRERGALPPSEQTLVGTYLKSLPDDGSAGLADEKTPTVK